MNCYPKSSPSNQKGAVLLESLIAILVFSFGVLALAGLQASMIQNTNAAKFRAEASFIAQDKISEIWLDGGQTLANYVGTEAVAQLPSGRVTVVVGSDGTVGVTVNWTPPAGVEHSYLTTARIEGI